MIRLNNVSKKFGTGAFGISDVSLAVDKNEFVFLVGPTGSGKTTIFRLLTREILPTEGEVVVLDSNVAKLPKGKVPSLRKKIGVVFQDLKLLSDRTILENVILPLEVSGIGSEDAGKRADEILAQVGLLEHKNKFPIQLSGGELQRASIARALILSPEILLADEPTGNLDPATSWDIVKLLADINEKGTTVIMATHNSDIVKSMGKRVVGLEKGKVVRDDKKKEKKELAQSDDTDHKSKENHLSHKLTKDAENTSSNKPEKHKKEENNDSLRI